MIPPSPESDGTGGVSPGGDESVLPIDSGAVVDVDGLGTVSLDRVVQRNWSRVARGVHEGRPVFVKQFVDRVGRPHRRGYEGDRACVAELADEVAPDVWAVRTVAADDRLLLTVSPYIEMATVDAISRGQGSADGFPDAVGSALRRILDHRRLAEDPTLVRVWKGIDPKNVGRGTDGRMWVFDFGPARTFPVEEAAARVVAAGLLSRWVARPGLHLVHPERDILRGLCEPLVDLTDLARVERELDQHAELRRREPQRVGWAATITRGGLATLGRVHWRAARHEARRLFSS